ncbi:MAG TPA: methyltransferase domain-containing protein [Actinomycetota bacterium]|nr:methyltransferase domain-containing protein [Actinomycetota bacterium]
MEDWRTYDDVAETYERVHAPRLAEVARDLVEMIDLPDGAAVLDVGTGTGVAAQAAADAGAAVVGVDESLGMLLVARRERPKVPVVAAHAIDLPFGPGRFDAVLGSFVLAHFDKIETALFDIARVMRPDGRVAFSSWSDRDDAYQEAWREIVTTVVPREMLASAYAGAAPGHDRLKSRTNVEEALIDADFRSVRTEVVKYRWTYSLEEYLDGLQVWATGRFTKNMLGEPGWASLRERARTVFAERFPDPLNDFRDVILATATKPA